MVFYYFLCYLLCLFVSKNRHGSGSVIVDYELKSYFVVSEIGESLVCAFPFLMYSGFSGIFSHTSIALKGFLCFSGSL